jgi:hypothetical protein
MSRRPRAGTNAARVATYPSADNPLPPASFSVASRLSLRESSETERKKRENLPLDPKRANKERPADERKNPPAITSHQSPAQGQQTFHRPTVSVNPERAKRCRFAVGSVGTVPIFVGTVPIFAATKMGLPLRPVSENPTVPFTLCTDWVIGRQPRGRPPVPDGGKLFGRREYPLPPPAPRASVPVPTRAHQQRGGGLRPR